LSVTIQTLSSLDYAGFHDFVLLGVNPDKQRLFGANRDPNTAEPEGEAGTGFAWQGHKSTCDIASRFYP
jgi:hypothetical protein